MRERKKKEISIDQANKNVPFEVMMIEEPLPLLAVSSEETIQPMMA